MSLHCVFLRIGPLVGDAIRDVSIDMLDFGDLWLRWECDELYITDVRGFISPRGSDSNTPYLGQDDFDAGCCSQWLGVGRLVSIICCPHGNMCYIVNG